MLDPRKNKFIIAIIAILLLSIVWWHLSKPPVKEKESIVFDDRISPMENQALFVEILRIRNRGLMDKMLSYGSDWKNLPSFYYIIRVDGKEGSSKGNVGETGVYNTWDTIGYESSMVFDVDEEQEYSDVTISIVELQPKGLFGQQEEVEKEKISLRYNYRTGRWTGDDYFMDKDGMGHYVGKNYEVWFNLYQADYDHDNIPYWVEVNILGTNPTMDDSKLDPDNDGIPTDWEWKYGYDPFTYNEHSKLDPDIDGIENIEEYRLREYFANPFQPDIYIETDGMEKRGFFDLPHIFYKESQQMIIERFVQHGINVYIDDGWKDGTVNGGGELLPYQSNLDDILGKQLLAFYEHNFADERKGIFRYVVVGVRKDGGGFITPVKYNRFDAIYVSNDFNSMITRVAFTPRELRVQLAKAILHELGHSLGLMPGIFPGIDLMSRKFGDRYPSMSDDEYNAYLEKYYSVMNYQYIYNKPWWYSEDRKYLFDYSDGSNGLPYDWNDWEHIYLPTFQIDVPAYEDPSIETFEDFNPVKDYPELVAKGWKYDENLTRRYAEEFEKFVLVKNTEADIKILIKEKAEKNEYNLRIYAKPKVEPVFAVYSLVAEGKLSGNKIKFYSQQTLINNAMEMIKKT